MTNLPPYDLDRALARQKSYAFAAVLTLVLYVCLWIPGVIANYLFLEDARRAELLAGEPLPGVGCLRFMWVLTGVLAGLFIAFWILVIGAALLRA